MKKLSTALLSIIYCLSIIGGMFAVAPVAVAEESAAPERVGEVLTRREKNSDTYLLEDGSYECVVYSQDKYYENEYGRLEEIDNTVVAAEYSAKGESYAYANKAGGVDYRFADNKAAVSIDTGNAAIAFSVSGGRGTTAKAGGDSKTVFEDYKLSGENYISYAGVAEGTDLVYAVKTGYLKEYIILKDSSTSGEITFTFDTEGLTAKPGDFGRVIFADESGEPVFELESLFAVDSAGAYTEDLEYVIGETRDGETDITVRVSQEYLNDADRVFPVLVDPSVVVSGMTNTKDVFAASGNIDGHYYTGDYLRTGKYTSFGITRSFIKFNIPSSVPAGSVTSAYISLYKYSGSTPSIKAYRITESWQDSNVTWRYKPDYVETDASGNASLYGTNEYRLNISTMAMKWSSGLYSNYGVMIKDNTENNTSQNTQFFSSDAAGEDIPELHITYNISTLVGVNRMVSAYGDSDVYDSYLQYRMNCYGYALGVHCEYVDEYEYTGCYKQMPGEFFRENVLWDDFLDDFRNDTSGPGNSKENAMSQIVGRIEADFTMLNDLYGSEWTIVPSSETGTIPPGYRKIALTIDFSQEPGETDFHFYLRHSDGTWSHKPGQTAPSNRRFSYPYDVITDNNIGSAVLDFGYGDVVAYFLITKPPIIDYCHAYGHEDTYYTLTDFTDGASSVITKSRAINLSAVAAWDGFFDYHGDYEYYSFTPSTSGRYKFTVSPYYNYTCIYLKLYSKYNVNLISSLCYSSPQMTSYLTAGQTYYIFFKDDDDEVGRYEFAWTKLN